MSIEAPIKPATANSPKRVIKLESVLNETIKSPSDHKRKRSEQR